MHSMLPAYISTIRQQIPAGCSCASWRYTTPMLQSIHAGGTAVARSAWKVICYKFSKGPAQTWQADRMLLIRTLLLPSDKMQITPSSIQELGWAGKSKRDCRAKEIVAFLTESSHTLKEEVSPSYFQDVSEHLDPPGHTGRRVLRFSLVLFRNWWIWLSFQ